MKENDTPKGFDDELKYLWGEKLGREELSRLESACAQLGRAEPSEKLRRSLELIPTRLQAARQEAAGKSVRRFRVAALASVGALLLVGLVLWNQSHERDIALRAESFLAAIVEDGNVPVDVFDEDVSVLAEVAET